jgi:hypothetical protein
MVGGCVESADSSSGEDTAAAEDAVTSYRWSPYGGCATGIGVAANNIAWILGCPAGAGTPFYYHTTGHVWSPSGEGYDDGFVRTRADIRGTTMSVDMAGGHHIVEPGGRSLVQFVWPFDDGIDRQTGYFGLELNPRECFDQVLTTGVYTGGMDFRTESRSSAHTWYALGCDPDANGNRSILWTQVREQFASRAQGRAVQIALQTYTGNAGPTQELWAVSANGGLFYLNDSINMTFGSVVQPPGRVLHLTDGRVLTTTGVYEYVSGGWSFVAPRDTATGQLVQIAHAQALDGSGVGLESYPASSMWGFDTTGQVYRWDPILH